MPLSTLKKALKKNLEDVGMLFVELTLDLTLTMKLKAVYLSIETMWDFLSGNLVDLLL